MNTRLATRYKSYAALRPEQRVWTFNRKGSESSAVIREKTATSLLNRLPRGEQGKLFMWKNNLTNCTETGKTFKSCIWATSNREGFSTGSEVKKKWLFQAAVQDLSSGVFLTNGLRNSEISQWWRLRPQGKSIVSKREAHGGNSSQRLKPYFCAHLCNVVALEMQQNQTKKITKNWHK